MFNVFCKNNKALKSNVISFHKGKKYDVLMTEKTVDIISSLDISPTDAKELREFHDVLNSDNVSEGLRKYSLTYDEKGGFTVSLCKGIDLHVFLFDKYIRIDSVSYNPQYYHVVEKVKNEDEEVDTSVELSESIGKENVTKPTSNNRTVQEIMEDYLKDVDSQIDSEELSNIMRRISDETVEPINISEIDMDKMNMITDSIVKNAESLVYVYVEKATEDGRTIQEAVPAIRTADNKLKLVF